MVFAATRQAHSLTSSISFVSEGVFGEIYAEMTGNYGERGKSATDAIYFTTIEKTEEATIEKFGEIYVYNSSNSAINGKRAYYKNGESFEPVQAAQSNINADITYAYRNNTFYSQFAPDTGFLSWHQNNQITSSSWVLDEINFNWEDSGDGKVVKPVCLEFTVHNTGAYPLTLSLSALSAPLYDTASSNLNCYYYEGVNTPAQIPASANKITSTTSKIGTIGVDATKTFKIIITIDNTGQAVNNAAIEFNMHLTSPSENIHAISLDANGGQFANNQTEFAISYELDQSAAQIIELPSPTQAGKTFGGYTIIGGSVAGMEVTQTGGVYKLTIPSGTNHNISLKAIWN